MYAKTKELDPVGGCVLVGPLDLLMLHPLSPKEVRFLHTFSPYFLGWNHIGVTLGEEVG